MLRWRLILGTFFIAALVGLCWLDHHSVRPGIYMLPLAIIVGLAAAGELSAMLRRRDDPTQRLTWVLYAGVLVTVLVAAMPVFFPAAASNASIGRLGWLSLGLAAALLLAQVDGIVCYRSPERAILHTALACLAILYVGGSIGFLVQLRLLDGSLGIVPLASLIATVKMSDTGQYFVGRRFGRLKLAPRISPGKTWEGVAGGALFAIVTAWFVFWWSGEPAGVFATIAYALALAAAGIVGDLAESMIKRDAGVKDSSTWMPGFGGVLDMLDSLLLAAPVAYLFWALGWVGS